MAERSDRPLEAGTHRGSTPASPEPGQHATQDEIVADIEDTREQLRETVDALSSKLDVKGNAKARVEEAKTSARTSVADARQRVVDAYGRVLDSEPVRQARANPAIPAGVAVGLVLAVVGVVVWRRRDTRPRPVRVAARAASTARTAGRRQR